MPSTISEAFTFNDRTVTGKVLGNITIDFCKTMSGAAVSQTGMTLTELGVGVYALTNPNITERTICSGYLTTDSTKNFCVVFDPVDGSIAKSGDAMTLTSAYDAAKTAASASAVAAIAAILTGITSLAAWLRAFGRKDTADATAKAEINSDDGSYDETTDSLQAVSDQGATNMHRLSALLGDNVVEDDIVRNAAGLKTSSIIYLYDTKAHAQTHDKATGLLGRLSVAVTMDNANRMTKLTRLTEL